MAPINNGHPLARIPGDELAIMSVVLAHHAIVSDQRDYLTGGNRDKGTAWIYLWSKEHLAWRFYEARNKHVASIFELSESDQTRIWQLVAEVRSMLSEQISPDAFNIRINDGECAGQRVPHAHVHVILRFGGDVPDPRGGVRWIIPQKAAYREDPA